MKFLKTFLSAALFALFVNHASADDTHYSTRNLNNAELQIVYHDLDQEIIEDHSFLFTDKDFEGIAFITAVGDYDGRKGLQLLWKGPTSEGGYFPLPAATSRSWGLTEVKAVAFGDFNSDGLGPDVITIAEYILPGTAIPSPVATVHFHKNFYTYTTNKELNRFLYSKATRSVREARTRIKNYLKP